MYLLDTNILSELMRPQPNLDVIQWLDDQLVSELYVSSITIAEIRLGIALLPKGKRQQLLAKAADDMLQDFAGNRLVFDHIAAENYATIVSFCTKSGRPISVEDAQIASIAQANNSLLVTRNIRDFEMIESLEIYNPFL